ncbi:MAG: GNAT family N-acetyltransferase [bacterium]|nr:GNAT family N-acetyltransferase [bacterium]
MTYRYTVDDVDRETWHATLARFSDAAIHQSWSFGAARWGAENLSRLVLERDGEVVAAAQVAQALLPTGPLLRVGIAHVKFGPMWRLAGREPEPEVYREVLRALREEYADRRGLVLRLKPWEAQDPGDAQRELREAAGFTRRGDLPLYKTFVLDLEHSVDKLHAALKNKWRYNLRRAQRHDHQIESLDGEEGVRIFMDLYREMHVRKGYYDTSEAELFPDIHASLPEHLRPHILATRVNGEIVAMVVISLIGTTGFYLFGATSPNGRSTGASYVVHWEAVRWLKEQGCRWYDLVGAYPALSTPAESEGIRQFKSGLTGKLGREVHMVDFDQCTSLKSRVAVGLGTSLRYSYRNMRHRLQSLKGIRK